MGGGSVGCGSMGDGDGGAGGGGGDASDNPYVMILPREKRKPIVAFVVSWKFLEIILFFFKPLQYIELN